MELADIHLKFNIVREFAGIPLPAAIVIRTVVSTRIDDRSRIDRRLNDRRRLSDDHRLSDHRRGRCHNSGLSDHNGIGGNDVMRERDRCRRQADDASRETESAVVVVMMMSPREHARSGRQRKSHNKDFLRVHDLPHLSVYVEHHRPTERLGDQPIAI